MKSSAEHKADYQKVYHALRYARLHGKPTEELNKQLDAIRAEKFTRGEVKVKTKVEAKPKVQTPPVPQPKLKRWIIRYTSSTDHDCCSVWCEAYTKQEAINYVRSEYWDIEDIIMVTEG